VMLGALAQGRIDAATPPEPIMTQSLQSDARIFGDPFSAVARGSLSVSGSHAPIGSRRIPISRAVSPMQFMMPDGGPTPSRRVGAILAKYARAIRPCFVRCAARRIPTPRSIPG